MLLMFFQPKPTKATLSFVWRLAGRQRGMKISHIILAGPSFFFSELQKKLLVLPRELLERELQIP